MTELEKEMFLDGRKRLKWKLGHIATTLNTIHLNLTYYLKEAKEVPPIDGEGTPSVIENSLDNIIRDVSDTHGCLNDWTDNLWRIGEKKENNGK